MGYRKSPNLFNFNLPREPRSPTAWNPNLIKGKDQHSWPSCISSDQLLLIIKTREFLDKGKDQHN
jgi:hypothetical protein